MMTLMVLYSRVMVTQCLEDDVSITSVPLFIMPTGKGDFVLTRFEVDLWSF